MIDHVLKSRSLLLFLGLAYGGVWGLFGLGMWRAIPFSMDPSSRGAAFYLPGVAVPFLRSFYPTPDPIPAWRSYRAARAS